MTTQKLLVGTIVGWVVLFFLGYLVFGILMADFYRANAGTATGVEKMPLNLVAIGIGQLAAAGALTLILSWSGVRSIAQGAMMAGVVGLLFFLGVDLTTFGSTNTSTLKLTLVEPVIIGILYAIAGGAIAAVAGKKA
jgi:hypothetical protein